MSAKTMIVSGTATIGFAEEMVAAALPGTEVSAIFDGDLGAFGGMLVFVSEKQEAGSESEQKAA